MVFEPLTNTLTVTPGIGLPAPSRAVIVMVEADDPELAAIDEGEITTVEFPALTLCATTSTVAVCATSPTPVIVAVIVLLPCVFELKTPVVAPDALVSAAGWVNPVPGAGRAASVTARPATGFPKASRTVIVMVLVPLVASIVVGDADTRDCDVLGAAAFTVSACVWVISTPPAFAATVLAPACVELTVAVNTPLALLSPRSEEHTSELQSPCNLVCRLLLEKKKHK